MKAKEALEQLLAAVDALDVCPLGCKWDEEMYHDPECVINKAYEGLAKRHVYHRGVCRRCGAPEELNSGTWCPEEWVDDVPPSSEPEVAK